MIILTAPIPNLKYQKESRQAANHGCCERAKWKFLMIMMFMLMILMIDDFKDDGGKSSWHQPVPVDVIDNQTLHAFLGGGSVKTMMTLFETCFPFMALWPYYGHVKVTSTLWPREASDRCVSLSLQSTAFVVKRLFLFVSVGDKNLISIIFQHHHCNWFQK